MLGIIGAMTSEVDELKNTMTDTIETKVGDMTFTIGKLCGTDAVVTVCGEGKVNAAMCTQAMIMEFSPDVIVNTGVGGGLADGLKICDVVVADAVVEHDMDMSPLGYKKGFVCGVECIEMPCDEKTAEALLECVKELGLPSHRGIVASGDQFVSSESKKQWLKETFNAAVCEMEGAAIGHVCMRNSVPFGVLRAISDGGDDDASMSFPEFAARAAENSIAIMKLFAKKIKR